VPDQTIDLYSEDDAHGGTRTVWLRIANQGQIALEGQDLGAGVALRFDGASEYEWAWTLKGDQVERLLTTLGIAPESADAPQQLVKRLKHLPRTEIADCFRDAGAAFWSRHGD
jgi:hypothetical protein